jgi:hypothetical protein
MGYSYTMSGALCCDGCSASKGVKKVPCPHGWCQPAALCAACRTKAKGDLFAGTPRSTHAGCAAASAAFKARQAQESALIVSGADVRCSAMIARHDRTLTHVLFRNAREETVGWYMPREVYAAIPTFQPATPDDYRQHGELTPAPSSYSWS